MEPLPGLLPGAHHQIRYFGDGKPSRLLLLPTTAPFRTRRNIASRPGFRFHTFRKSSSPKVLAQDTASYPNCAGGYLNAKQLTAPTRLNYRSTIESSTFVGFLKSEKAG
jgi:hypothetical protein